MQTCSQCKSQQLNGVLFCSECGATMVTSEPHRESTASLGQSLPAGAQPPAASVQPAPVAAPPAPQSTISLVVINSGRRITLDAGDDLLVGRKDNAKGIFPDVDLGLDGGYDAGVSRRHAIIVLQGATWAVEDLDSANGTFVNGERVRPKAPATIRSGDELKFGTLLLRVEL